MSAEADITQDLQAQVREAAARRHTLCITGSGSKAFYGRDAQADDILATAGHRGIVSYEPSELVITARAGTPLADLEATLAGAGQMLAFEPPHFGAGATLGGTIACGLSGPRRPYTGAARDVVLGTRLINGRGEVLRFGGQVMKNVAGYDLSRLMAGAMGTLGVLLEVSLKVLPRPATELTVVLELPRDQVLTKLGELGRGTVPLSATCYTGDSLYLRLSGTERAVAAARKKTGGDVCNKGATFWHDVREQRRAFFQDDVPLWRLSLPPAAPWPNLPGKALLEWGGALRWYKTTAPPAQVFAAAATGGGHAMLFRGGDRKNDVFQPLKPALLALHRRIKTALDPRGLFNPGRLYHDL